MKRNINFYLDRAIERSGCGSNRKLSLMLGLGQNAVNFYRLGKAFPSDETMEKLARIAGVDPFIALLDLNTWRATGAAQEAYVALLKKITAAVIAGLIVVGSTPARAENGGGAMSVYNHKHNAEYTLSHP